MTTNSLNYAETFKKVPGFQELDGNDLSDIQSIIDEKNYSAGMNLLEHHKPVQNIFILKTGQVEVLVNNEIVALVDAVSSFGEMSCLSGEEHASATVRAVVDCTVLQISRENFLKFINLRPRLIQSFFKLISSRVLKTNQRLSEVLNHAPQGLIKIDSKGVITNEYSKVCCSFFNRDKLSGINFIKMIFPDDDKIQKNWQEVLDHLFHDDKVMKPAALFSLLPQEISFNHLLGVKTYKLSYYRCLEHDLLSAIDIGVEDITQTREFELREKELEKEKEILKKIYDAPDSYVNLIALYESNIVALESFHQCLTGEISEDFDSISTNVLRLLHNLKGTSGFFSLDYVSKQVHSIETLCLNIKMDKNHFKQMNNLFQTEMNQFKNNLTKVKNYFNEIDPELKKRLLGIIILPEQYVKLKQLLRDRHYIQVEKMINELEMVPVKKLVQNWPSEIERLGARLNKFVTLEIIDNSVRLPPNVFNKLSASFIHFLRNCMDHGLETLEEREEMGKEDEPKIIFRAIQEDNDVLIEIEDNGRGIDYSILKQKALENKNLDQRQVNQIISENELWRLLFLSGLSTAKQTTDISGRGVGLEAIYSSIQSMGGAISVLSELGKGTVFRIRLSF